MAAIGSPSPAVASFGHGHGHVYGKVPSEGALDSGTD